MGCFFLTYWHQPARAKKDFLSMFSMHSNPLLVLRVELRPQTLHFPVLITVLLGA